MSLKNHPQNHPENTPNNYCFDRADRADRADRVDRVDQKIKPGRVISPTLPGFGSWLFNC